MTAEEMTKKNKKNKKNAVYRSYQSIYCITACEMIGLVDMTCVLHYLPQHTGFTLGI